ncbi:MAG: dethiobiotin synthase [Crocinitomicaceae bacterium]
MQKIVISGIGTDVGKTVVSAIVAEYFKASYWKPVQSGDLENSDSVKVKRLTENVTVLEEKYKLTEPLSPHESARIDNVTIDINNFSIPEVNTNLIIEGAGGLMVPFNYDGDVYLDLFEKWNLPVIVVSRNYLGSINHTLLTVNALKQRNIPILGIIFSGESNQASEKVILAATKINCLARIPEATELNKDFILEQAKKLNL